MENWYIWIQIIHLFDHPCPSLRALALISVSIGLCSFMWTNANACRHIWGWYSGSSADFLLKYGLHDVVDTTCIVQKWSTNHLPLFWWDLVWIASWMVHRRCNDDQQIIHGFVAGMRLERRHACSAEFYAYTGFIRRLFLLMWLGRRRRCCTDVPPVVWRCFSRWVRWHCCCCTNYLSMFLGLSEKPSATISRSLNAIEGKKLSS